MNTPAENRAAMDRAKGKQPEALRTWGGYHFGKLPDPQKHCPHHARPIR